MVCSSALLADDNPMQFKNLELKQLRLGSWRLLTFQDHPEVYYETWILGVYDSLSIMKGDVVLDVGANIGDFALLASSLVGEGGTVIAIEPNPVYFEILKQNVSTNELHNVICLNIGVADTEATAEFRGDRMVLSSSDPSKAPPHESYSAEVKTIDGVLKELNLMPSLVKLDIEGSEVVALRHQNFLRNVDELIIESHSEKLLHELLMLLNQYGFRSARALPSLGRGFLKHALPHIPTVLWSELKTNMYGTKRLVKYLFGKQELRLQMMNQGLSIIHATKF